MFPDFPIAFSHYSKQILCVPIQVYCLCFYHNIHVMHLLELAVVRFTLYEKCLETNLYQIFYYFNHKHTRVWCKCNQAISIF